jgi:acetolactate synthase-1/2/3 large subunit
MTGAELIVQTLKAHGVEHIAVLCGNGLNALLQACNDAPLRLIDVRNEQSAAYIADVWGAMTGRLGVVAVSAGPGHTNALTGVTNAWWDGRPMLLISGCSEAETRGLGHFQELNQIAMAAPVTKYARLIERPEQLAPELRKAIHAALSGRPGPVHLTITLDVMGGESPESVPSAHPTPQRAAPCAAPDPGLVAQAAEMLQSARKPAIVAGSGCFYARAGAEMKQVASATDIPLFSLMWDRCCIDECWPQYVGPTTAECNGAFPLLAQADVILTLGGRADFRLGYGLPPVCAPDARFIRVDIEPGETVLGPADLPIVADPRSFLAALLPHLDEMPKRSDWLQAMHAARAAFVGVWDERLCEMETPVPALCVIRALKPFLDRDVTFLLDGGNIGRWAHMMLWDRHPAFWQTCGASGVIGWGLAGAISAKLARPDHPVLLLVGDGSAGFTLADIETALRHGTPYVAVVASDAAWGIVAECFGEDCRRGSELGEIRFDKVAEGFGARGVYIENGAQLAPAIEEAIGLNTVTFIHVPIQLGGIAAVAEKIGCAP